MNKILGRLKALYKDNPDAIRNLNDIFQNISFDIPLNDIQKQIYLRYLSELGFIYGVSIVVDQNIGPIIQTIRINEQVLIFDDVETALKKMLNYDNNKVDLNSPKIKVIRKLGRGGQGEVFLIEKNGKLYAKKEIKINKLDKQASERFKREIEVLKKINHPNLIKIHDYSLEEGWFIMDYYPQGTLDKNLHIFKGDIELCLKEFRKLLDGIKKLHKEGIIHRDIKPKNIFVKGNNLILGDMGLVFIEGEERLTRTEESVGSIDWMPPWAHGKRLKEIKENFDIFSLGKVVWSMISGKSKLPFLYFNEEEYNLEKLFPDNKMMYWINNLLSKCVVDKEEKCLQSIEDMIKEVEDIIFKCKHDIQPLDKAKRKCKVCGAGFYKLYSDLNQTDNRNFGIHPKGMSAFKIYVCDYCGHTQLFYFENMSNPPPAWKNKEEK
jgi:serine/threonine protein kinase